MTTGCGSGFGSGGAPQAPPAVRVCSAGRGLLSEGPRWDADRAELVWVDILAGEVHTAPVGEDGRLGPVRTLQAGRHVGAAAPAGGGGYVLAAAGGFWHADGDGGLRELAQPEAGRTDVRMNDGICDPKGRFWAGTMAYAETPGAGRLYRLELDGTCTLVLEGLTISNGMGWSPDGATMYLSDSGTGDIFAFDFDPDGGTLDHRRTLVHVTTPGAAPDGRSTTTATCGSRCGTAARWPVTPPTGRCGRPWRSRSTGPPPAPSAGSMGRRCSSPPPATVSTRRPSPASRRPDTCCA
ncbi:MAG: SMP-30/Gluconolaconase/LRE domain protein [Frankiales bacterium]|nr:SMP-30/Gluconolaconase/LRE domain protein [Frankiales bacterium]